jgi:hypothetical protein
VVVLALGGGAYAMKDSLFGPQNPPADSTTGTKADTSVQQFSQQDTTKRDTTKSTTDSSTLSHVGGTTNPGPGTRNPAGDSPRGTPTPVVFNAKAQLDSAFTDIVENEHYAAGRTRAMAVYTRGDQSSTTKADAAFLVYQSFMEQGQRDDARTWLQRAIDLNPRADWQTQLNRLNSGS